MFFFLKYECCLILKFKSRQPGTKSKTAYFYYKMYRLLQYHRKYKNSKKVLLLTDFTIEAI